MTISKLYRPRKKWLATTLAAILISGIVLPVQALAVVSQPAATARVSFTFDDGFASVRTQAAPTLATYGLSGTSYVTTSCVGMTTVPNTCRAKTDTPYMTWNQIAQLQTTYGWEIGSHTVTHPCLTSNTPPECQANKLTTAQVVQELSQSKADLAARGINATSFASPYGDYDPAVLAQIAKFYTSHRGFADVDNNIWPFNDYLLNNYPVQEGVTVAQVKAKIDAAIAGKHWLVLTFHDIKVTPSTDPDDFEYSTAKLGQIAAYVKSKQTAGLIKTVNPKQGVITSDINLLPNSTFDSGIANGWTTDTATAVSKDTANNGSFPSSTNSIKIAAAPTTSTHLFTPKTAVDMTKTYLLKSFLNLSSRTSGELGYYIDEYDISGNWVSGQWKRAESTPYVKSIAFTYKPTSVNVKQASLQVYVTPNSGITAYLDNFQWFALDGSGPTTPPPPATTNIMPNSTFDSGISAGWTTDNAAAFASDSSNNGSPENQAKSVKMTAPTTGNAHLFSPKLDVDSVVTYTLKPYVKLLTIQNNEIGFYVDEYDAAGNWVSGKYYAGPRSVSTGNVTLSYKPTSTAVKKASLQVILTGGSGASGYIDNVLWIKPS